MRHRAHAFAVGGGHADAVGFQALAEFGGRAEFRVGAEDDDVGVDFRRVEFQPWRLADGVGEQFGVGVIFGEAVDVVVQRVEGGGGEDAGLAPAAAEGFAESAGESDLIARADQGGADGGAEALLKQTLIVSKCWAQSRAGMPEAMTALKRRAPSRWRAKPRAAAHSPIRFTSG